MTKSEISALIIAADFTTNLAKVSPDTAAAFGVRWEHLAALREVRPKLKCAQLPGEVVKIPNWIEPKKPKNIVRFDPDIPF